MHLEFLVGAVNQGGDDLRRTLSIRLAGCVRVDFRSAPRAQDQCWLRLNTFLLIYFALIIVDFLSLAAIYGRVPFAARLMRRCVNVSAFVFRARLRLALYAAPHCDAQFASFAASACRRYADVNSDAALI